jgi:uncharacterized protein YndB with AHSA1/START domain
MKSEINITGNRLQLTRVFQAPRPLVFSWWTQAEKLQQWSGCKEMVKCEIAMDFRVGGSFTQNMQLLIHGKACDFSVTGAYDEIIDPEKIVYHANFGNAVTRVTIEFFDQGKATKVVVTHEGCPDEFFAKNVSQGTSDSFDKLDSLLPVEALATPR